VRRVFPSSSISIRRIDDNRDKTESKKMSRRRNSSQSCCTDVLSHLLRLRFTPEELEQRDKSRKIDKFLEKDKNSFRRQVKLGNFPHHCLSPSRFSLTMNHFSVYFTYFLLSSQSERVRPKPRELQLFIVYIFFKTQRLYFDKFFSLFVFF
jgi:hypothetical protein